MLEKPKWLIILEVFEKMDSMWTRFWQMSKIQTTLKANEVIRYIESSILKYKEVWYAGNSKRCEAGMTSWSLSN